MKTNTVMLDQTDVAQLIHDVQLIKDVLLDDGELTEWAKKELGRARSVSEEELLSMDEVEEMIRRR